MKQKLFTFLLVMVTNVGTMSAWSAWRVQIGDLYYNLEATTHIAEVTYKSFDGYSYNEGRKITVADIPSTINYNGETYTVTSIGDYAFRSCYILTSVTIPNSVTNIGEQAFCVCYRLTSVVIPNSVSSIGNGAFMSCSSLTSITFNNTPWWLTIGSSAFSGCSSLTAVNITNIDNWVSTRFEAVDSNPLVMAHNLYLNGNLVSDLVLPDDKEGIMKYAFKGCTSLTSITGNHVLSVGKGAFEDCTNLTSVAFPRLNQSAIEEITFAGCSNLTSLAIPNTYTSIKNMAFYNCKRLKSIVIPKTVTIIASNAFIGCDSIISVEWNAKNCNSWNFGSQVETFTFGNTVEVIPDTLCKGMNKLTSITIPINVTSIGTDAFKGCSNVKMVQWNAKNCNSWNFGSQVETFTFGNTVEVLPSYICQGMKRLTSIIIPSSVTSIGWGAFAGCSGLTSITIPENVSYVGESAFSKCSGLKTVTWNAKNCEDLAYKNGIEGGETIVYLQLYYTTKVPENLFFGTNSSIKHFVFGDKVEYIPAALCCSMNNLTTVVIGENVKNINVFAFNNCAKLSTIEWNAKKYAKAMDYVSFNYVDTHPYYIITPFGVWLSDGIYDLKNAATNIKNIIIGKNVSSLPQHLFYRMQKIESVICKAATPPAISTYTFDNIDYAHTPLCVPSNRIAFYKRRTVWKSFNPILPMEAQEDSVDSNTTITPTENSVIIEWPVIDGVDAYTIEIKKNAQLIRKLIFDEEGCMRSIALKVVGQANANYKRNQATAVTGGWRYEIPDLEDGTRYSYTITACDSNGTILYTHSGVFSTIVATFTISFVNWDKTELLKLENVEKGTIPMYIGEDPVRPDDEEYTYTFNGWTPTIVAAMQDATYTATYSSKRKGEGLDDIEVQVNVQKVLRDGQIYILRGDKTYTLIGQKVQ